MDVLAVLALIDWKCNAVWSADIGDLRFKAEHSGAEIASL
jgi:hypothetical protein